ncbi:MAG: GMP synthase [Candidatus Bathyarchaeota archaeon]|nr:GMP synthase [Candidatus Bathyarchaeota archaeon]MDH5733094.1 GMP synthase [Candidatus Bathyarchaeota archaeon]
MKFVPQKFVEKQTKEIGKMLGDHRALVAVSGGVDSVTCAALTHRAIGENLLCVMLDDAFMREGEPERIARLISRPPLQLPIKTLNVQERFLEALEGHKDAEAKRKAFRETFYNTLRETAEEEGCQFLVQGTIAADIVETTRGVKTQHNVLAQMGINPIERFGFQVIEPLASIYKGQVRKVARYLGVPSEISERQPFPGPGLSVRTVGEIKADKLEMLKKATAIAEEELAKNPPSQFFAVIIENAERPRYSKLESLSKTIGDIFNVLSDYVFVKVFQDKATGVKKGQRLYGDVLAIKAEDENGHILKTPIENLVRLQDKIVEENPSFARVLYAINETGKRQTYSIVVRAVETVDFLTASVAEVSWTSLEKIADRIFDSCPTVSSVYYDVTPKPPATIEFE